jgi:hypothetical protein
LKGVRTNDVSWGLRSPTERQTEALAEKGLTDLRPDDSGEGVKVHVPMPVEGMEKFVQKQLAKYYSALEYSGDSVSRLSAIISLYESLEAMHPFKDATSRTNHLVLNKLLVENGFDPAILNEPNSPTSSSEEFGRHVVESMEQTREIAGADRRRWVESSRGLADVRRDRAEELDIAERYGSFMGSDAPKRPSFMPGRDIFTTPFQGDLTHLMGGEREHIPSLKPPSLGEIEPSSTVIDASEVQQDSKQSTEMLNLVPPLDPRLEGVARRILGNGRIDDYLAYKARRGNL